MRFVIIIFISLFFNSCASGQKEQQAEETRQEIPEPDAGLEYLSQMERDIVGEWSNNSMKVWVRSYNNSDTSFIVEINEDTWEMKMNIKPIVTTIRQDGTYSSEFRNSFDSLIYRPEGTWLIDGDSLFMKDSQKEYKYQIFIDGGIAEFKSMIDWDKDGKADDEYSGIQIKNN